MFFIEIEGVLPVLNFSPECVRDDVNVRDY